MISKSLFLGVLAPYFILNQASAQFERHHQQFFILGPEERFDSKALTPVEQDGEGDKLQWAFAGTFQKQFSRYSSGLLAKLGDNTASEAFDFEWAKEYFGENGVDVIVEDVHYDTSAARPTYILCGQVDDSGFLLRTDADGEVLRARIYPEIFTFKSVVPMNGEEAGYIAVGETQMLENGDSEARFAAYVSVKRGTLVPDCALRMTGRFPRGGYVDSAFNQVIQYNYDGNNYYAAVGTSSFYNDDGDGDDDVLVALVGNKCELEFGRQYGERGSNRERFYERGFSIAQYSESAGGLVITGNTLTSEFDDILIFKINRRGTVVNWMGHYDVESSSDIGIAVQTSDTSVMIAGQAETSEFGPSNWDTFLLKVSLGTGNVQTMDVFSLFQTTDNGALFPGNLDLHESDDGWVIMGNTEKPTNRLNHPYLIEHYNTVEQRCRDERMDISRSRYELPNKRATTENFDVGSRVVEISSGDIALEQRISCSKTFPPLQPTPVPPPIPAIELPPSLLGV